MKQNICFQPIGKIRTPHQAISQMPVQPGGAAGVEGIIELKPEYLDGLEDLDGFSHIILIYHFHLIKGHKLKVIPFLDDKLRGIFATRSPARPNAIGISTVRLKEIRNNLIYFDGADMLDGTPLLDIKPFFPKFDNQFDVKSGWLDEKGEIDISEIRSDSRFRS